MTDDWKGEIARRLKEREQRRQGIEQWSDRIDAVLFKLLNELKFEYHLRTNYRFAAVAGSGPRWTIAIEDVEHELTSADFTEPVRDERDVEAVVVRFLLDRFTFR
ncbi:hypothetical protein [Paenibacillus sp.]|uniref:hypothetical protein n=1 Tax=Paenibacillus sp. TaxID=58172 RepID=UPI002D617191|nr:hypothetical protein [Paenibacillus sp.]HZG88447.1 hypothetical protein [Paenibacillus sp.]